ncbi:MAG: aminotransferase class IV [Spirochaetales bacterium]
MSCYIRTVDVSTGAISEAPYEADSLAEAISREAAGGVYAAFATWYGGKVVRLTHHLERLVDSARRVGIDLVLDRTATVGALGSMLERSGYGEAKIRISVAPPNSEDQAIRLVTVAMEQFAGPPKEAKESGVRCSLLKQIRRDDPRAKRTDWLKTRASFAPADGVAEQLLVREDGAILEGASSNFYAIDAGAILYTAEEGILFGTSRAIVLEIAPRIVQVKLEPPQVAMLPRYAECFLSSASRGIIPIVTIDETAVGDGTPGPLTRELMNAYDALAKMMAEPLLPPVA